MDANAWPQRELEPTRIRVGPCAWSVAMLAGTRAAFARDHPSLVVVGPDDGEAVLTAAAANLGELPLLLAVREPAFERQVPGLVRKRLALLNRRRAEAVVIWSDEVTDLKGGGLVEALRRLRREGVVGHLGAAHADVRSAEWLALHTPMRLLLLPYALADQAARYRATAAAAEHGMACVALAPPADDADALRFALAEGTRVLPVLDRPLPPGITAMSLAEVEAAWDAYRATHPEPAPLPRGRPPE